MVEYEMNEDSQDLEPLEKYRDHLIFAISEERSKGLKKGDKGYLASHTKIKAYTNCLDTFLDLFPEVDVE